MFQPRIGHLLIRFPLLHRIFVVAVEGRRADHIKDGFLLAMNLDAFPVRSEPRRRHFHLHAEMDAAIRIVGELLLGIIITG